MSDVTPNFLTGTDRLPDGPTRAAGAHAAWHGPIRISEGRAMRNLQRRLAVLAAALVAVVAAGCGGGDGGDGSLGGGSAQAASGEPQPGGTARIIVPNEPANLDPATFNNSYTTAGLLGNALFGQLLRNDPETGEIQPGIAESLTTEDNTTWTLKLRPGVKFTDGTPFDAAAVKYNWDRLKDPAVGAGTSASAAAAIASTTVVDDLTLTFTLARPSAHFGQDIVGTAGGMNFIASPAALEKGREEFNRNPVGAGPFVMDSWTRQSQMVLKKNPDYYDAPRPYLDELIVRVDSDMGRRLQSIQAGEADLVIGTNDDHAFRAEQAGLVVTRQPLNGGNMLIFNMTKPPFDDLRARQAIHYAIDRQLVNDAAYGGRATVPETLMVEGTPFHEPDLKFPTTDREKAQQLFDELAAEGKPVEFTIIIVQAADGAKVAQSFQAQLEAFENVKVHIETLDISTWFTRLATGDFGASIYGVISVDPEPGLSRLVRSDSPTNYMKLNDPEIDAAIDRAAVTTDTAERKAAYRTVQQRLIEQLPFISYVRPTASLISTPKVGGIEVYGQLSPRVDGLWLDRGGD